MRSGCCHAVFIIVVSGTTAHQTVQASSVLLFRGLSTHLLCSGLPDEGLVSVLFLIFSTMFPF